MDGEKSEVSREYTVFTEALEVPLLQRQSFLRVACDGDDHLRQRVEQLLEKERRLDDFLEEPPTDLGVSRETLWSGMEQPGDVIDGYQLIQQIGEGGCGTVYLAEQSRRVRRQVAMKIIKPGMDTKSVIARFEAEKQALALMDHPNIAKVFDAGATPSGRPYFVMELIAGMRITDYCDVHLLPIRQRIALFIDVCHGVQHAHQKGVIHRDLKPSNVLVRMAPGGAPSPVIIDFGIAKATKAVRLTEQTIFTVPEMLLGTPPYMSPEQTNPTSVDIDTRADVYSLGSLLYELLTGGPPFDSADLLKAGMAEARRRICQEDPDAASVRLRKMKANKLAEVAAKRRMDAAALIRNIAGDLDWIVLKALEKDRARRYVSANDLALDLQRYLNDEPILARPPNAAYRFSKLVTRNKLPSIAIAGMSVIFLLGFIIVATSLAKERKAHRLAGIALQQSEADKRLAQVLAGKSIELTRFLEDMLQGVAPSVARGRDTALLREILDRTSARLDSQLTHQPEVESDLRSILARLYLDIGNYDRAVEMDRGALAANQRLFGMDSLPAAKSLSDMGDALYRERKLPEAEQADQAALNIRQRHDAPEADVATSLNNLGSVYRRERKFPEAERLIRQSLAIRERIFGQTSLETADSLHNLCVIMGDENQRAQAETMARELLAIRRKILPADDPRVASAIADLAWATGFTGKNDEAFALDNEALSIRQRVLGNEHPDVAKSIGEIGERLRQRGQLAAAETNLLLALAIQRRVLDDQDINRVETTYRLGMTFRSENKQAEAEPLFRETLAYWTSHAGSNAVDTLAQVDNLSAVLVAQAKLREANELLDRYLTPALPSLPVTAALYATRAEIMGRTRRWPEALANIARARELQPDNYVYYHISAVLAAYLHDRTNYDQICQSILGRFDDVSDPFEAERIAQDCLLLPGMRADPATVGTLVTNALATSKGAWALPFFQSCKAIYAYRQGQYREAVEWAGKSLGGGQTAVEPRADAILALAYFRLGDSQHAREALTHGKTLLQKVSGGKESQDLASDWVALLGARVLLDEADALISPIDDEDLVVSFLLNKS